MPLRSVSLFSGAGGLDVGFEAAGFTTVFANELDHDAAEAWRANRPDRANVMVEGDIAEHLSDLAPLAGTIDVLFGGPPCQGFSVAGKMDPTDERSKLVWTFLDAVELVRPKVFVIYTPVFKKLTRVANSYQSMANVAELQVDMPLPELDADDLLSRGRAAPWSCATVGEYNNLG